MADVENQQDSSFPVKRKSDLFCQDQDNVANKSQKLNSSSNSADSESKQGEISGSGLENLNSSTEAMIGAESSVLPEKAAASDLVKVENGVAGELGAQEEQEDGDEEEDEDEDDEEEEDYAIEAETEIDRKGKGISREDKGKGKMIEVDETDDEDDSDDEDDEGVDEDDESDFSDDPLTEVDLDNILPSRTRRRSSQPGVYISNEVSIRGCNNDDYDDDDDSSDDSDA